MTSQQLSLDNTDLSMTAIELVHNEMFVNYQCAESPDYMYIQLSIISIAVKDKGRKAEGQQQNPWALHNS